ncbi:MAG: adaptor protein MecA [Blautia sp.]|nr:adaptor protein MecA [Lachnoclostridium sp.]MCM1212764.1 adaptor protein MecA [Blautia sp.]
MKYKKINEATVQCIISEEDMEEYGLTLADIFERNEKGEGFLRDVVERAHEEVGYRLNGDNIAMQITPIQDEGLVITFSDAGLAGFQNMLEHIKEVLSGMNPESIREAAKALSDKEASEQNTMEESYRIFAFSSMNHAMRYCAAIPAALTVRSHLYKVGGFYYLVVEKQRLSKKNFNKISAQAVEFAMIVMPSKEKLIYLEEHGECLVKNKAVSGLRKVWQPR